jgi:hypothetical protein
MVFFVHMTEKEEQASPRTASPSLQVKDTDEELRTEPVQEMLDSIDEVWRCQGPKVEFSCFFSDHTYRPKSSCCPLPPQIFHGL